MCDKKRNKIFGKDVRGNGYRNVRARIIFDIIEICVGNIHERAASSAVTFDFP